MAIARVPLASKIESRTASTAKDARLVNGLIESKGGEKQVVKRPGLASTSATIVGSGKGRGVFSWDSSFLVAKGTTLSILNTIYGGTSTSLGTLTGTAPISWVSTAGGTYAALHDGASIYTIDKATKTLIAPSGAVQGVTINNGGGFYGEDTACTVASGATTTITKTGHGLVDGQGIEFSATTIPAGMSAFLTYQVRYVDANSFTINTVTDGGGVGSAVVTTTTGSSVVYRASPTVTFSAGTVTALGTAKLFNHVVSEVVITTAGTYTTTPTVVFSDALAGSAATISPSLSAGTTATLTQGSGYVTAPDLMIAFVPGGYLFTFNSVYNPLGISSYTQINSNGKVTSVVISSGGPYNLLTLNAPTPVTATGTVVMASSGITGPFASGFEYLDGYCFIMKTDGSIYQSDSEDPTTWDAANVIRAESDPDNANALVRHLNYLIAFGTWSTDVFYNAGNPTGSILNVNKSAKMEIGCAVGASVAKAEQTVVWMGQSKTEGRGIYLLDGMSPTKVSTRYIDKYLNASNLSEVYSLCFKIAGHTLYLLTLVDQNITLVYDLEEKEWYQWDFNNSSYFTWNFYTGNIENTPGVFLQDSTNGNLSELKTTVYNDGETYSIYFRSVTPILDSGTTKRKFFRRVEVIGDKIAGSASIHHTSDDYQTWSTYRTVTLSDTRPVLYQNGSSRRRAYELLITDNIPVRLDSLEIEFDIGGQE